jgi:type 1 glutamine amidotransferase
MRAVYGCALLLAWLSAGFAQPATNGVSTNRVARVLIVTGMDYPGHLWRKTSPVLADALRKDPRLNVFTVEDPWFLDSEALQRYDVIVLHFENWEQPAPGEKARENLRNFVQGGKGIVLLHFGCGAWHDEWPEFAKIAGRVWAGSQVRQHDPFGPFRVEIAKSDHPITRGLTEFDTQDELYTCLKGDYPIEILAQAKSRVDGKYYPMAFVSNYGKGRTFHCTLGHDAQALSVPAVQALFQRGCAWAAGLEPVTK